VSKTLECDDNSGISVESEEYDEQETWVVSSLIHPLSNSIHHLAGHLHDGELAYICIKK